MSTHNQQIHWAPGVTLDDVEKQVILAAYQFFHKNKTATARALNIAIRTLDMKLEKYSADDKAEHERQTNELARRKDFLKRQRGSAAIHAAAAINPDGFGDFRKHHGLTTEGDAIKPEAAKTNGDGSAPRYGMESPLDSAAQSPVSVSQRKEVQGVPSQPAAKSDPRKTR